MQPIKQSRKKLCEYLGENLMNRTFENFKLAMAVTGCFVASGLLAAGFWWLFDLLTGHTAWLFALAGY